MSRNLTNMTYEMDTGTYFPKTCDKCKRKGEAGFISGVKWCYCSECFGKISDLINRFWFGNRGNEVYDKTLIDITTIEKLKSDLLSSRINIIEGNIETDPKLTGSGNLILIKSSDFERIFKEVLK